MKYGMTKEIFDSESSVDDIIITGLPRSGTTLLCMLLSEHENVVALNEPMDKDLFKNHEDAIRNIETCFKNFRASLLESGKALARTKNGNITDNAYTPNSLSRQREVRRTEIQFSKKLDSQFTLAMKHCAEFTLLFPEILEKYSVFAVIRNPLALLGSWNSVNVPVSRGRVAKAQKLNKWLFDKLENMGNDILGRQLFIMSWYFEQFKLLSSERIIRYEDIVTKPSWTISRISGRELSGKYPEMSNKNTSDYYDSEFLKIAGPRLLESEGSYWDFYSREDIINIIDEGNRG